MTPNQTQGIGHQRSPIYVHCSTPCPKFSSASLYNQLFSRYCTFLDFAIDSHVNISRCHCPMSTVVPRVPNICPFRSTISRFQDITHFKIFPLTPMLKFVPQKCHKICIFWEIAKIFITLYFPITTSFTIKFGSNRMQIVGEVAFWKFCSNWVPY